MPKARWVSFFLFLFGVVTFAAESDKKRAAFVKAKGRALELNGRPFLFKGICFTNNYTGLFDPQKLLSSTHHTAEDFKKVKKLGLNAVRFAFRGEWYDKSPKIFFQWLDRNVAWAGQAGVFLILDLHVPVGGSWLDQTVENVDYRLWTDSAVQQKTVDMWKAIASRYKDEPIIGGYDIVNEPVTADSTGEQWKILADQLVKTIRGVDKNHLIVIGRTYGVNKVYTSHGIDSQFLVDDDNIMYDFHFYEPMPYTHQKASWVPAMGEGGKYPDPNTIMPTGRQTYITSLLKEKPQNFAVDSSWRRLTSKEFTVKDPRIKMAAPILAVKGTGSGTVFFDEVTVTEFAESGKSKKLLSDNLDHNDILAWWGWNTHAEKRQATFIRSHEQGTDDSHSLAIADPQGADGISGWSGSRWFKVQPNHSYQIQLHLKTEDSPKFRPYFDLAFYGDPENGEPGFIERGPEYLKREFMKFYRFGEKHQVPMSVLEFGLMHHCFKEGRGGAEWVKDMLELFLKNKVSFAYWNYHGENMGLHLVPSGQPPANINQPLADVFKETLN